MAHLEVVARASVRPGQLAGLKAQAAEIIRLTQELDTRTLRCDWFITEDGTACEVHEKFADEQGLIEHQMHIVEARTVLFRDYATDHRSTIYGVVSEDFLRLVMERMGAAPARFSFLHGLGQSATMGQLEVHAHLRIRPGLLKEFEAQAAELVRLSREKDTQTLRYDWFVNEDGTECEVHEAYQSEQGLIEHNIHVLDARAVLFEKYAYDHRMTAFGEISQELRELANRHAGGIVVYSFLQGLGTAAAV